MGGEGSGMPKAALIKLDGTEIDKDGNESQGTFFDFLKIPLGEYADLEKAMTPEAALKFRNHVIRMKIGVSAAIPMLCSGREKCPMGRRCPFNSINVYPISEACPLEVNLVQSWTKTYIEEFAVDTQSTTQMVLINRLVELDLLDYRANVGLSGSRDEEAPTLLKTTVMETDTATSETVNLHPLLDAKSKFHHERLKVLEALVATPREKYKQAQALGQKQHTDAAQHMAELTKLIARMKESATGNKTLSQIKEDAKLLEENNEKDNIVETDWHTEEF